MKILHVSMGLPPFRVGGLNEYCFELMKQQLIEGHDVGLLYPGEFSCNGIVKIVKEKPYILKEEKDYLFFLRDGKVSIALYKIKNPLPLSLIFGINEPMRYMKPCNQKVYIEFLEKYNPEVIHVHCLQGIHKEFFEAAKSLGKRIVFTTHDYFPICSKCTLYNENTGICNRVLSEKCALCNIRGGLSKNQEIIMQSRFYANFKYSRLLKSIRRVGRRLISKGMDKDKSIEINLINQIGKDKIVQYEMLFKYYSDIMSNIDVIHCNSAVAEKIYRQYYPHLNYQLLHITRTGLNLRPIDKIKYEHEKKIKDEIIIGYVGGKNPGKGLDVLIDAVFQLDNLGEKNWKLHLYGGDYSCEQRLDERIIDCGFFRNDEREKVYSSFDILIAPSSWPETFGFIVPEALSVGTPVICSNLVGAQECIKEIVEYDKEVETLNYIFESGDSHELAEKIIDIYRTNSIFILKNIDTMEEHSYKIHKLIYNKDV